MAGRIQGRAFWRPAAFARQCVSVVLAVAVVAQPVWAAGPVAPQLSSKSGAAYTIFINFSGFTWNQDWGSPGENPGTVPAYTADGDATTFSGLELANIHDMWSRAAEKFAAFNINVTTVDPASTGLTDAQRQEYYNAQPRMMHTVIGGTSGWLGGGGGVSYVDVTSESWGSTSNYHLNWAFPNGTTSTNQRLAEIIAHENGHGLGLDHQSDWNGSLAAQYSNGGAQSSAPAPIMGQSYTAARGLWSVGYTNTGVLQNDIGRMFSATQSTVAVVDDGVGHATGAATALKAVNGTVDFTSAKGVITTVSGQANPDPTNIAHYTQDYWSFTTTGGNVTLNAISGRSTINSGVADGGKTLDAALTILASDGTTVVTSNATYVAGQYDATVTGNLTAGTYFAKITTTNGSDGAGAGLTDTTYPSYERTFFDIGSYFVTGTIPGLNSEVVRYWDNASGNGFGTAGGTWTATTSDVWNTDSTGNATRGSNVSIATLDAVHFGTDSLGLAAGTVNVSGNVTANRITFGAASGAITLSGGTITLASVAPTVTVNNATSTIASVLDGNAGLTKAGSGTLVLSGANTYTGTMNISAGTVALSGNASLNRMSSINSAANTRLDISGISAANIIVGSLTGVATSEIVLGSKGLITDPATSTTYAGVISGTGGSLTKAGVNTLTLSGNNTFTGGVTVQGGTLSLTGNNTYAGGTTISGGTLSFNNVGLINTSGNITFTGNGSLQWSGHTQDLSSRIVMANGANATIDTINNNVTFASAIGSSSTGAFTKAGGGALTLSAASTYNGTTTVSGGTLRATDNVGLPGALSPGGGSNLNLAGGILETGANLERAGGSGQTQMRITSGTSGFSANGANVQVAFGTLASPTALTWGTAPFQPGTLVLNGATATHAIEFVNAVNLNNGGRTVQVNANVATMSGVLSGTGASGITKTNGGTLALTNTNTYIGATTVSGGTLEVSMLANGGANSNLGASSNATANLVLGGGTLRYTGATVSTDRGFTLSNNSGLDASGTGAISFTNTATPAFGTANQTRTLTLTGTNTGNNTLAANLANNAPAAVSVTKTGTGTWVLSGSSTHTGVTTVSGGTLAVSVMASGGSASGVGASTSSAANLLLANGTTFRYAGAANATTDRGFTVNGTSAGHGATIESSGAGTLSFDTPATTLAYGTSNQARTLTLGGTNTGVNTFGKIIANNGSGATSLIKSGAGRWVLDQVNTYNGTTAVNGGSLVIGGAGEINTSSAITVAAGAQLVYNSSTALTRAPSLNGSVGNPAVLSGIGTISVALTLDSLDDVLSPGNSPGVQPFGTGQTWSSFTYAWEVNDWTAAMAGTNIDQIGITGSLNLSGSSYGLDLFSLTSLNASGDLANFAEASRSWTILSTTTGISGFLSSEWNIDAAGFTAGSMPGGSWSLGLASGGNDLLLSYAPVPEPESLALLVAGLAAGWQLRRKSLASKAMAAARRKAG